MHPDIEKKIIEKIIARRDFTKSFSDIVNNFDTMFSDFTFDDNSIPIQDYFGEGFGRANATKKLLINGHVKKDWLRDYKTKKNKSKTDFKGLYVFLHGNTPFYVGISKGVIGRVNQHVKGHNHNTSNLAYKIALKKYEIEIGKKYMGGRKELNFKTEVKPIKDFLLKQKVAWLNIDNDEELFLFEIYCSMKLKTTLNDFRTH